METRWQKIRLGLPRSVLAIAVVVTGVTLDVGGFSSPAGASVTAVGVYNFSGGGESGVLTISSGTTSSGGGMELNIPVYDCTGLWTASGKTIAFEIPPACQGTDSYVFVGSLYKKGIKNGTANGPFGTFTWSAVKS